MRIITVKVKNFRSIEECSVLLENNALVLVGQNNAGKSSFINSIRAFWNEIEFKQDDFHKDSTEIEVTIQFRVEDNYFFDPFVYMNTKVGITKIPSTASEFNAVKEGTPVAGMNYNQYKDFRVESINTENEADIRICTELWAKVIKDRLVAINDIFEVSYKVISGEKKGKHLNQNGEEIKDFLELAHKIAFIDDDRNFTEEEEGKTKTLTNNLFGNHIMLGKSNECQICTKVSCTDCVEELYASSIENLDINDLEKLVNHKIKSMSSNVSDEISAIFQENFKDGYKITINSTSNVDKSFSLNTKIYIPTLDKYVELSKVGAGVRSIYILSLLQAFLKLEKRNSNIFIVEEPEIYLHPSLQKLMASILYEISLRNLVFITTHSPIILNRFELNSIRKVYLNDNLESQFETTQLDEILKDLGYSTSDILYSEYIIFVEGKNDKKWLETLIQKFYNVDINKFFIIDTKSCSNIETYATLRFLNKTNLSENFLIFRDSDTMDRETVKRKIINAFNENLDQDLLTNIDDKIHIFNYSSFDNFFLNPDILVSLGIIASVEVFYERISNYININQEEVRGYLIEKNPDGRANTLFSQLYDNRSIQDKLDDIRMFVRGHNLFGQFSRLKRMTTEYINNSNRNDFIEILQHLEKIDYLRNNLR